MTETGMKLTFDKGCSNYIPNRHLERILYSNLQVIGAGVASVEEKAYAEQLWATFSDEEKEYNLNMIRGVGYVGDGSEFAGKYVSDSGSPYDPSYGTWMAETDVSAESCV